eukprot:6176432-Pleurochrysis_carterae.AAC.7
MGSCSSKSPVIDILSDEGSQLALELYSGTPRVIMEDAAQAGSAISSEARNLCTHGQNINHIYLWQCVLHTRRSFCISSTLAIQLAVVGADDCAHIAIMWTCAGHEGATSTDVPDQAHLIKASYIRSKHQRLGARMRLHTFASCLALGMTRARRHRYGFSHSSSVACMNVSARAEAQPTPGC